MELQQDLLKNHVNHSSGNTISYASDYSTIDKQLSKNRYTGIIRIAVIDDEALARRALCRILGDITNIEIVGECSNAQEALTLLSLHQIDLIFLDIEMQGISGMDLAQQLKGKYSPLIVFVTAYDKYALEAFKVQAIDYILKPISEQKICEIVERIRMRMNERRTGGIESQLSSIIQLIEMQTKRTHTINPIDRFTIKNKDRIYFVKASSIDWIEAEGNYLNLHTGAAKHLLRMTMNQIEQMLDLQIFIRIHRSIIVNSQSIIELSPGFNGTFSFLLKNNAKILSSRNYKKNVEQIFKHIS